MKMKMLTIALVLAGSVFAAACDKVGYTCEGAGTCEEPRYCINGNTLDYYWTIDGRDFDDPYDVGEYCGDYDYEDTTVDRPEDGDNTNQGGGYNCDGAGTCDEPLVCCSAYDCYYETDGSKFYCDEFECEAAANEMVAHCM